MFALPRAHAVEGDDVWVLQAGQELRLALEVDLRRVVRGVLQRLYRDHRLLSGALQIQARAQVYSPECALAQNA